MDVFNINANAQTVFIDNDILY